MLNMSVIIIAIVVLINFKIFISYPFYTIINRAIIQPFESICKFFYISCIFYGYPLDFYKKII